MLSKECDANYRILIAQKNVLVDDNGAAVLCDFGFSRIRHERTRPQSVIPVGGASRYLAPELTRGSENFRTEWSSDIYSMAMTFFALGTKSIPFSNLNEYKASYAAQNGDRPQRGSSNTSPVGLSAPCAGLLWRLMENMWDSDSQKRWNAFEVAEEMDQIAERLQSPTPRFTFFR